MTERYQHRRPAPGLLPIPRRDDLTRTGGSKTHSEHEGADDGGESGNGEEREESQKSSRTILEQEITAGLHELERPAPGLAMSALSAGLDLGFSVLLMGVMLRLAGGVLAEPVVAILAVLGLACGLQLPRAQ